jgi:hypothetical protein
MHIAYLMLILLASDCSTAEQKIIIKQILRCAKMHTLHKEPTLGPKCSTLSKIGIFEACLISKLRHDVGETRISLEKIDMIEKVRYLKGEEII